MISHACRNGQRDPGVQDSLIKRIAGHEDGAVTFSVYGSRSPLRAMADALRHIHLPAHPVAVTERHENQQ